jgi:hypothetical protein
MLLMILIGCDEIDMLFAGLTDKDIAEGVVLGVEADPGIDLTGSAYEVGAHGAAYLSDMTGGPAIGALSLVTPGGGTATLAEAEQGVWATQSNTAFVYQPGEVYAIHRDGSEILRATAAAAADLEIPTTHAMATTMAVDASDQDFDALMGVVLNLTSGEMTWSKAPDSAGAAYELLIADPSLAYDIPAEAFPTPGNYAIGLAGLQTNKPDEVTDVNSLASLMGTGVLHFHKVVVTE